MFVTPGVVVDGKLVTTDLVDINLNIRILLGSSYYDDWKNRETFVKTDPLGNPVDQEPSVEPDDDSAAAKARLRRQVHVGDVAALARQAHRRPSGARYRWRTDRAVLGDRACGAGRHRLHQVHRSQRENVFAEDDVAARSGIRVEDSEVEQRNRTRSRPHVLPGRTLLRPRSTSSKRRLKELHAGRTKTWTDFKVPEERYRLRLPRSGTRRALAPRGDQGRQDRQLPSVSADAVERKSARYLRDTRAVRRRGAEHADLRRKRSGQIQGHRHHARRAQLRSVPARAASTCI